jgi:hypothetical protein
VRNRSRRPGEGWSLTAKSVVASKARGLLSWITVRGHHVVLLATALVIGSQRMLIITCATWCATSHHATADASAHDAHAAVQHVSAAPDNVSAPDECRHVFARFRPSGPAQVVAQPAVAPTASGLDAATSSAIPPLSVARIAADHGPPALVLRI